MTRRLVMSVLVAVSTAFAAAAQTPLSVGGLMAAARQGNLELQKASQSLVDAEKNLAWESDLANASATLSGDYSISGGFSGRAQVSVPIVPQVSLSANVSSSGSAGVSLGLSLFAAGRPSYQQRAAYETAKVQLEYQSAKVGFDVASAAYGVIQAQANVSIAKDKLALAEQQAGVAQQTYDIGELSYDDLQAARSDLIAARQSEFDAERGLLSSRVQLYRLLGPAAGEAAVAEVTAEELLALIGTRDAEIVAKKAGQAGSLSLRQAEIALESLRAQLKATLVYRPNLGISGQLGYSPPPPSGGSALSGSASVSYKFSPSDIKTDDRASISQSISQKQRDIELEQLSLGLQARILDQALAVARQVLETRRSELAQAEMTLAESRFLQEQGERTSLEVEQTRISLESTRLRLFQAAAAVLDAQAAILLSYSV